jgi:hypothetical protein
LKTNPITGKGDLKMYSPKVKEDLIPILYKLSKQEEKPMTALIDEMLRAEITKRNGQVDPINDEAVSKRVKKTAYDGGS